MSGFDLKKSLKSIEETIPFVPFVPLDNAVNSNNMSNHTDASLVSLTESTTSVNQNIQSLTALLKSSFLVFLKNMSDNPTLRMFLESYLTNRMKPLMDREEDESSVSLFQLDKLVFSVFYRVASPNNEHRSVVSHALTHSRNEQTLDLDAQYAALLDSLPSLRLAHLLDLVAVVGDSNAHLSHRLLASLSRWKPQLEREILQLLAETQRGAQELVQTAWQTLERFEASLRQQSARSSGASAKGSRVIDKAALLSQHKQTPRAYLDETLDLVSFAADIVYSLHAMMSTLDKRFLAHSALFTIDARSLSQQSGMTWYSSIQLIYEAVLPLLTHLLKRIASQQRDEALQARLETARELCEAARYWALHNVQDAFDVCVHSHTHPDHTHTKAENNGNIAKISSHAVWTWLDVWAARVDVDKILIGASLCDVTHVLALGSLASDFMRSCDRAVLRAVLCGVSGDTHNVHTQHEDHLMSATELEHALRALCLEDSLWPTHNAHTQRHREKVSATQRVLDTASSSSTTAPNGQPNGSIATPPSLAEQIETIRSIFPEISRGFAEACLSFFEQSAERVIDALLSENLPPQLAALNRTLERLPSAATGAEKDYKELRDLEDSENKRFTELQKALVQNMERMEQRDAHIVDKMYDDDYDDQYDDGAAKKKSLFADDGGDWRQRMDETRRYNTLLRAEEKEAQFWQSMANTNRAVPTVADPSTAEKAVAQKAVTEKAKPSIAPRQHTSTSNDNADKKKNAPQKSSSAPQPTKDSSHKPTADAASHKTPHSQKTPEESTQQTQQQKQRQYERNDKRNDAHRRERRMKKERAGGFLPGV